MNASTPVEPGKTLLIVDDEPLMTDLARQYMTRRGFRVLVASSGQEALEVFEASEHAIDLVIMDVSMPGGMDGIATAQELYLRAPETPILLASGHDPGEVVAPPNVVGVAQKPFKNRELADRVLQILRP